MARRVLWAMFTVGLIDKPPVTTTPDYDADEAVAQKAAEESLVLLNKEGGLLPQRKARSNAINCGEADKGVLSGGGSSLVTPRGGWAYRANDVWITPGYLPSSPLQSLQRDLPHAAMASTTAKTQVAPPQPRRRRMSRSSS